MAIGPGGKYDKELTEVKRKCGATSALLVVLDGRRGPGFACQATLEHLSTLPEVLEAIAKQMRADRENIPRDA